VDREVNFITHPIEKLFTGDQRVWPNLKAAQLAVVESRRAFEHLYGSGFFRYELRWVDTDAWIEGN
jgi:hypothetical protein